MLNPLGITILTILLSLFYAPTVAAENNDHTLHAADIQPWRIGAEIFTNGTLFEADFGDLNGGSFSTDEPGIDVNTAKGTFTPGHWLRFQPTGRLLYWNGVQWSATAPNGERIEITDALDNVITFDAAGVSENAGVIGEIGSDSGLHEHLNFKIVDISGTPNGTPGAYRIQLRLFESQANSDTSVAIAASSIAIVFNRGLAHQDFELAVAAADDLHENAVYAEDKKIVTIPRVKALGSYYRVKLQQISDNLFQLIEAYEIPQ
ncbi:MAG: hypothetical protein LZF61_03715 [Nitrosomonas sp.]|nr:MAG: hypothetical protein LZF61_03715 [Nitrosomonas sp.]